MKVSYKNVAGAVAKFDVTVVEGGLIKVVAGFPAFGGPESGYQATITSGITRSAEEIASILKQEGWEAVDQYIAARYDGAGNICATVEAADGSWTDAWFMAGEKRTPMEVIEMAEKDEASRASGFVMLPVGKYGRDDMVWHGDKQVRAEDYPGARPATERDFPGLGKDHEYTANPVPGSHEAVSQ